MARMKCGNCFLIFEFDVILLMAPWSMGDWVGKSVLQLLEDSLMCDATTLIGTFGSNVAA